MNCRVYLGVSFGLASCVAERHVGRIHKEQFFRFRIHQHNAKLAKHITFPCNQMTSGARNQCYPAMSARICTFAGYLKLIASPAWVVLCDGKMPRKRSCPPFKLNFSIGKEKLLCILSHTMYDPKTCNPNNLHLPQLDLAAIYRRQFFTSA